MLDVALGRRVVRVRFNDPKPVVSFSLPDGDPKPSVEVRGDMVRAWLGDQVVEISFKLDGMRSLAYKKLGVYEHVLGLGEKAYPLDRRRARVVFWNYDNSMTIGSAQILFTNRSPSPCLLRGGVLWVFLLTLLPILFSTWVLVNMIRLFLRFMSPLWSST
ncbi:MAG TPA: hypothetical protein VNL13_03670 [Sulfolobales archaeon]|nr:hypothetical protein [Sulfolobales archaeon]